MFKKIGKGGLLVALLGSGLSAGMVEPLYATGWRSSPLIAENADASFSYDKTDMIGYWVGQIETKSGDLVSVRMRIYSTSDANLGLELIYGGNRHCTLNGALEGQLNGAYRFSLTSRGGVYCDKLGQLSLMMNSGSSMSYTLKSLKGQVLETGSVTR